MRDKDNKIITCLAFLTLFLIRLIYITNPPLDYSSWRQVDTDSIARNFVEYKFNIFFPQLNYDGPMPNYVQLEFQVTTFIIAIFYKLFGYSPIFGRIVPIAFFMGSCYYLYLLVKMKTDWKSAVLSVFLYGIIPINIIYSRNIMPESALMFFVIGALYYFALWIDCEKLVFYVLAIVFTILAIATKLPSAVAGIPMIYLCFAKYGRKIFKNFFVIMFPIFVFGAPYLYFRWLGTVSEQNFVRGIGNDILLPNLLKSIFEKDTAAYLLSQLKVKIITIPGAILFAIGLIAAAKERLYLFFAWIFAAVLHIVFINAVIHLDYYFMVVTPAAAVFMGCGAAWMISHKGYKHMLIGLLAVIIINNINFLKDLYRIQGRYVEIGNLVSQYTGKDELIIIGRDSPELLYTCSRKGWRLYGDIMTPENIRKLKGEGAGYFVPYPPDIKQDIIDYLDENHTKIVFPDGYFIYRL